MNQINTAIQVCTFTMTFKFDSGPITDSFGEEDLYEEAGTADNPSMTGEDLYENVQHYQTVSQL